MLSGKELLQHALFSSIAALLFLLGLFGAAAFSRADEADIDFDMLAKKLLVFFIATIFFVAAVYSLQKAGHRLGFFFSMILIYSPMFICLGWAVTVYMRSVLAI